MIRPLDRLTPGLFAGTYVVTGALFAADGLQKLVAGPAAVVRVSGAIELAVVALVAAASGIRRRFSIS